MYGVKIHLLIKGCIALAVLILGGMLLWNGSPLQEIRHTATFVVQIDTGMDIADITLRKGAAMDTRLQASIHCIQEIVASNPGYAFGLITQGKIARYLLPPTQDTGTFLHYVESIISDAAAQASPQRSTGMQLATKDITSIRLGKAPPADMHHTQYILRDKMHDCKGNITSSQSQQSLSQPEQQGVIR